ncbi:TonB-dependent receptor [Sphingobium sufflavum]|uniref:TonB-dependent receptor n=1 Tax=Sphingobium sufflavum TaxID=1129547 RepID=UPI001F3E756A|nr:TonB-dependent receptor [Sphingobium sufflavum]MCE7795608.1 TonB-dependent receptor [Sphingobium sufflavum]
MTMKTIRLAATASVLPFAALFASTAFAQAPVPADAAPAEQAADAGAAGPGDIVVTARRREESAQGVPIALSVLDGKTLDGTGAFNVARLQQLQPAIQFYSSNPRNSAINIRGLGAPFGLTNDGIEQGVGFYVDGVYIGRIGVATMDFIDVERLEVLRGPQGTLYGKNTTSGALNITTRKPSFTPEGQAEFSVGNYHFVQAKASVSGPLSDKLAVRLSASGTRRDGTVLNTSGLDLHRQDNVGARAIVLWKPTDTLDFSLSGDFNVQNPLCCVQYYARTVPNAKYTALANGIGYKPASLNPFDRVTDLDAESNSRQEIGGASLVSNWDFGPATLTSVTAYRYWDWKPKNDRDFVGLPITTISQNPSQQRQFSQELRIASNGKNTIDYTFGAYFFTQAINTQGSQVQGSRASYWLLSAYANNVLTVGANAANPAVLNGLTSTNAIRLSNQSAAIYGKLNWAVNDRLHIQPGLRLNYDKKTGSYNSVVSINNGTYNYSITAAQAAVYANNAAQNPVTGATSPINQVTGTAVPLAVYRDQVKTLAPLYYTPTFSDWNLSGDVNVSYDFSRDIHAYATYAYSFKSGGINLSGIPFAADNVTPDYTKQTVAPEKVNHYEIGLKTQWLDKRLTINLAGYWTDISDYQTTVNGQAVSTIRGYLANADKVRSRGGEFDTSFRPSDRLSLYFNGAYTDAEYVRFTNAPCPPEKSGTCDISGQVLPGVSKWSFSYGGEVNLPVGAGEGQIYAGYDGNYRSRFSSNPSPSQYMYINGYSLSNFRLGYREGTKLNIFAWVRNAFDENYFELLTSQSGSTGLIIGQPADPRTWGLTVKTSF